MSWSVYEFPEVQYNFLERNPPLSEDHKIVYVEPHQI